MSKPDTSSASAMSKKDCSSAAPLPSMYHTSIRDYFLEGFTSFKVRVYHQNPCPKSMESNEFQK
ncbi:hypothetical protein Hanom_Chr01g00030491 [Helianthus anomalus]